MAIWAEKKVVLPADQPEPGPLKLSRTPYLIEVLNCLSDPTVEQITMMCSTQVGKTTMMIIALLYVIDQYPGTTLWVMPKEDEVKRFIHKRLKDHLEASPEIRAYLDRPDASWTKTEIRINGMDLILAWSGSESAVQSNPCSRVFLDELSVFKYPRNAPDPVNSAKERTRVPVMSTVCAVSTPKWKEDLINREYSLSDRRKYFVPCPSCGKFQNLHWNPGKTVRWPAEVTDPNRIQAQKLATYHCEHCDEAIPDSKKQKMLERGLWCPAGCTVNDDGELEGEPEGFGLHAGFHLNAFCSPWLTWSHIVAHYLKCKKTDTMQSFVNHWLGLPYEDKTGGTEEGQLLSCVLPYPKSMIPPGVLALTAGVDVGDQAIHYVVRGWGANEESWLIEAGAYLDLHEAIAWLESHFWQRVDGGDPMRVAMIFLDSGDRTEEVYSVARAHIGRVESIKGVDSLSNDKPLQTSPIEKTNSRYKDLFPGITLTLINSDYFKLMTTRRIRKEGMGPETWHIHQYPEAAYLKHIASEERVIDISPSGIVKPKWKKKEGGHDNHWWDAEVYAVAAAYRLNLPYTLRREDASARPQEAARPRQRKGREGGGWMGRKRGGWIGR